MLINRIIDIITIQLGRKQVDICLGRDFLFFFALKATFDKDFEQLALTKSQRTFAHRSMVVMQWHKIMKLG